MGESAMEGLERDAYLSGADRGLRLYQAKGWIGGGENVRLHNPWFRGRYRNAEQLISARAKLAHLPDHEVFVLEPMSDEAVRAKGLRYDRWLAKETPPEERAARQKATRLL